MDFDWKKTIGTVAPTIATALGGPVAGLAVGTLGKFLGLWDGESEKPKDLEGQIATAIQNATPDQMLALRQEDHAFQARMQELGINVFALEVQDRASARAAFKDSKGVFALGFMTIAGFFTVAGWIVFVGLPHGQDGVVDPLVAGLIGSILGYLAANAQIVYGYFFGSSMGSTAKTQAMASSLQSKIERAQ